MPRSRQAPGGWPSSTSPTACTWPTGRRRRRTPSSGCPRHCSRWSRSAGRLLVLSGLAQQNAAPMGDEGGDHARSLACFLTGTHPLKTDGADIRAGRLDRPGRRLQIGHQTRLALARAGHRPVRPGWHCDSGYSCAYSSNISWKSADLPMAKEIDPGWFSTACSAVADGRSRAGRAAPARALGEEHPRLRPRGRPAAPVPAWHQRPSQDRRIPRPRSARSSAGSRGSSPATPPAGRRPEWPGLPAFPPTSASTSG